MRKEQVDDVVDRMPSHIANFDDAGIRAGVNQLGAGGLLADFVAAAIADIGIAKQIITKVWNMAPPVQTAIADINKYTNAYNSSIKTLPARATPGQVVDAIINFWVKLLH